MTGEYVLVFKRRGIKEEIKITRKAKSGYVPNDFSAVVNFKDFKNLAIFLHDLNDLWGAPVDKAIREYNKNKEDGWAF